MNREDGGQFLSAMLASPEAVEQLQRTASSCRIKYGLTAFCGGGNKIDLSFATNRPFVTLNSKGKPLPRNHLNQVPGSVRPSQLMPYMEEAYRYRLRGDAAANQHSATRKFLLRNMRFVGRGESRSTGRNPNSVGVVRVGGMGNYHVRWANAEGEPCTASDLQVAFGDRVYVTLPKPRVDSTGIIYSDEYMFTTSNPLGVAAATGRHTLSSLSQWVLDHIEAIMRLPVVATAIQQLAPGGDPKESLDQIKEIAATFGDEVCRISLDHERLGEDHATNWLSSADDIYELVLAVTLTKIVAISRGRKETAVPKLASVSIEGKTMTAQDYFARQIAQWKTIGDSLIFPETAGVAANGSLDRLLGIAKDCDEDEKAQLRESRVVGYLMSGKIPPFETYWQIGPNSAHAVETELRSTANRDPSDLCVGLLVNVEEDDSITILHARSG